MRQSDLSQERADLLESLGAQRYFLISATEGMTDEQARERSTVSELTLGGLIKHVAATEKSWADFAVDGPDAMGGGFDGEPTEEQIVAFQNAFRLTEDETLAEVLQQYAEIAAATDELVRTVDLDHSWPLPAAPWFTPGATRSARRVFVHIVGETAQHAGHADIIREAIDGKKSMG